MGRMDLNGPDTKEMEIASFGGLNTAKTFSEISINESPKMLNNLPRKLGGLAKRDGTRPLTTASLPSPIKTLTNLRKGGVNSILAGSGTILYKLNGTTFAAQTMTNALNNADFDSAQFKDHTGQEALIIADGSSLKMYNGTAVLNITPAANDTTPADAPVNVLATINSTMPPIGCIVHNTRLVVWGANSDQINHGKIGFNDYFRATDFQRFVRENDYVVQCIPYSGALLVLMRRHIGVLFGDGYTATPSAGDWSQDFIDTSDGCVNPKSVQLVIYPDGREEVFYQSDKGVHAVYTINTLAMDSSARYSTRNVTKMQIDYTGLGVTKTNWQQAKSYFHEGRYWLIYKVGSNYEGIVFDTNDQQWRPVDHILANAFLHDEDYFYFAGDDGHLKVFDSSLYSDWNEAAKTTMTPINWYWYSKLMTPKLTGFDHFWDVLMVEAKQWSAASTIDVEVNTYRNQYSQVGALKTEIFVIGISKIGQAQIPNNNLTDIINNAKRIPETGGSMGLKGQYAQVKLSNNRDEPVEVYSVRLEVRQMTKY